MFELNGKVAFITGAASGIGEQVARLFAKQGARVVMADLDEAQGRPIAEEIGAQFVRLDVTDPESLRTWLPQTADELGSLDILVNDAGVGFVGTIEETTATDFRRVQTVNVDGVFYGCKYAIPVMLRQGRGNIINIGSVAGLVGVERRFAYAASKGAVIAMTKQIAVDYATKGIRANCICPGTIYTPFVESFLNTYYAGAVEDTKAQLHARQPIGRMGRPDEVAYAALYLAADESEFATGSVLTVDGGWTAK